MTKVELYEQIRKAYFLEHRAIRQIARHHRVHRRQVRQAIKDARPPAKRRPQGPLVVLTDELKGVIDDWLLSDKQAPKKQRHTAPRIFNRLVTEYRFAGSLPTIKRHVGARRRKLGLKQEGYVPLTYEPGAEGEVDWYEAWVDFPWGQRQKVYFFQMRACYSGRCFHMAFARCTAQAFLEAHTKAFEYYGGVFKKLRYDNLTSAVTKVLRGRKRQENERFTLLRSHYLFEAIFCQPGVQGAHEKGGVENGVGYFRRQYLTPVPAFKDFQSLNDYLIESCRQDDLRTKVGQTKSIDDTWQQERSKLLPLPKESFDYHDIHTCRVNSRSLIHIKAHCYSVPVALIGQTITLRLSSQRVSCHYQGRCVACHERCHGRYGIRTELDHYLELLWKKPGAVANALPLKQARAQPNWHPVYEIFWEKLIERHGHYEGTRHWLDVLMLLRGVDDEALQQAMIQSMDLGCYSLAGVQQHLMHCPEPKELLNTHSHLIGYQKAPSQTQHYDDLLTNPGDTHGNHVTLPTATQALRPVLEVSHSGQTGATLS